MIYLFLANGFEEIEALTPADLLRRAGKEVVIVGVGSKNIVGAHGITVTADICTCELTSASFEGLEMVVLPGGMPGAANLAASDVVNAAIAYAAERSLPIAAICAAPAVVLGGYDFIAGKRVTCYPGFEGKLASANPTGALVETDRNVITGKGPGAAMAFALALVAYLCGEDAAQKLKGSLQC